MAKTLAIIAFALATLLGCSRGDSEAPSAPDLEAHEPNRFLTYFNRQASLAAGRYQFVVDSNNGAGGSYTLDVSRYGEQQHDSFDGQWPEGGTHTIHLSRAGGLNAVVTSSGPVPNLKLLNQWGDEIASAQGKGDTAVIDLPMSKTGTASYSRAYYRAVDPNNERDTLNKFLQKNGFNKGHDAHVTFRDTKDLGYGREMYARRNDDGSMAFYVRNYFVDVLPGLDSNYSTMNVHAAADRNPDFHIGTNAIEFSPIDPDDPNSEKILKFFTYWGGNNPTKNGQRRLSVDLDGRGDKAMPNACFACHGGRILPLDENGEFPLIGLQSAHLNQLEVNTFEFSDKPQFSQSALEAHFKTINKMAFESYPETPSNGQWNSELARDVASGRYGGDFTANTYNEHYIPSGWQEQGGRPAGVSLLYQKVVEPHCISCHALQGSTHENSVSFASYEDFMGFEERILDYVYERGVMPLSLRNYTAFWESEAPSVLASYLPNFDHFDESGNISSPGRVIARAGDDRTSASPAILDGNASSHAERYQWELLEQPNGAQSEIAQADTATGRLISDTPGNYRVKLTVSNALGSDSDELLVTLSGTQALTFESDIRPLLGSSSNAGSCTACHSPTGISSPGNMPVHYDDGNPNLYRDVLARVNLEWPERSKLLVKPSTEQHGGGVVLTDNDRQTLLRWIREGARP
ncbi:hypothetical protein GP5015_1465 [gamma proteobacterium HTCC5015]|nr:hypothetical protein GP5015_1465 [gamma proteobacterium HTCC5015]